MSEQRAEEERWMEWRGLQGARGSVYALMSGTDSGKLAFFAHAGTGLKCQCCGQTAGGSGAASAAHTQTHACTYLLPTFIL